MALTKAQMIGALDQLIEDGNGIHKKFLEDLQIWPIEFVIWMKGCESTIEAIYGSTSEALTSFKGIYFLPPPGTTYANDAEKARDELVWFDSGLRYGLLSVVGMRYSLDRLLPPDAQQR